jgi:hypothetical protein
LDASETARSTEKTATDAGASVPMPESVSAPIGAQKPEPDPVEAALAKALEAATDAKRWDIVGRLAGELEARRSSTSHPVISLAEERAKRGR